MYNGAMRSTGLTLIELLVVISILALLAALLFPVFHSAREHARTTVCAKNVQQLLVSLSVYEAANDSLPFGFDSPSQGVLPSGPPLPIPPSGSVRPAPPGGYPGNAMIDRMGWWWFNSAGIIGHKSLREMKVLQCPSKRLDDPKLARDILCGNYGVNRSLCKSAAEIGASDTEFRGQPLPTSALRHPGLTLLVMDTGYSLISWWHVAREPPVKFGPSIEDAAYVPGLEINARKLLWQGQKRDAVGGRHPGKKVNVGFADGHVRPLKAGQLLVEETEDGDWDRKPLWCPE
jgi:prepilin-type processing-associated H-X9-DG protein/prepilin-type N-terminal cleavage/methylation domain-containing protein